MRSRLLWGVVVSAVAACNGNPASTSPDARAVVGTPHLTARVLDQMGTQTGLSTFDFGTIALQASRSFSYVVVNDGDGPSEPLQLTLAGTPAEFGYSVAACANHLEPNEQCFITLSILPKTIGPKSARFSIRSGTMEVAVAMTATSVNGARIGSLEPGGYTFPAALRVGTVSPEHLFTFQNSGGLPTGTLAVSLSGFNPEVFEITSNTCVTLAPSATCTVGVAFHADTAGRRGALVDITSNSGESAYSSIDATASADDFATTPIAVIAAPYPLSGYVSLRSLPTTFTVVNTTAATSDPLTISIEGANATAFHLANDLCTGAVLTPQATCTYGVYTTPVMANQHLATIRVSTATTGGGTNSISMNASIFTGSFVTPDVFSLDFGAVTTGQSDTKTIISKNVWTDYFSGTLHVLVIGTNADQFVLASDTCDLADLVPGTTCATAVRFQPTTTGAASATLVIANPTGNWSLPLTGSGL